MTWLESQLEVCKLQVTRLESLEKNMHDVCGKAFLQPRIPTYFGVYRGKDVYITIEDGE